MTDERLDTLFIRAAVDAYKQGVDLNLAEYAAAILPKLCDEIDAARNDEPWSA